MKKVLILPIYGIGDALIATPAIRNLKEQCDSEITMLHMFETTRDILLNNPHIDEHILFPFLTAGRLKSLSFLWQLRGRFDFAIICYPANRRDYNIAALISGARIRVGHHYVLRDIREMHFLKNRTILEDDGLHAVEENLRLLRFFGILQPNPYPLEIYLSEGEKQAAETWIKDNHAAVRNLIGIHPGTSVFKNHGKKRWPESSFAALIDRLADGIEDSAFIIFGGPEEKPLQEAIIGMVRSGRLIVPGPIPIRLTAALMERCSLFISNDSGPMHMAAASGVPVVALFGPTNPVWVHPWGVPFRIVGSGLPCSPCFRYSPIPIKCSYEGLNSCMGMIKTDDVFHACLALLAQTDIEA